MPLGLVCGEKSSRQWMGMSKCGSAARLGVCMEVWVQCRMLLEVDGRSLRKVNTCKYPPIGSIIILPDDVYKSSKIMLPKEGLCL